jgi:alcohol dehydrogenase
MLLPSVGRWNGPVSAERYAELLKLSCSNSKTGLQEPAEMLAERLEELAAAGGLSGGLCKAGILPTDLPMLAEEAVKQWTGNFNPRPFDSKGALEVYEWALQQPRTV